MSLRTRIRGWLSVITVRRLEAASYVGGLVSLVLIATQLHLDSSDRRVAKSLEIVARFNSEPLSNDTRLVTQFALSRQTQFSIFNQFGGAQDIETSQAWGISEVQRFSAEQKDQGIYVAIFDIAGFFNELRACADSGVCDRATIDDFFDEYARSFWTIYGGVVNEQARQFANPGLAKGLVELGAKPEGAGK